MSREFDLLFAIAVAAATGASCPPLDGKPDMKLFAKLMREQAVSALATRAIALTPAEVPNDVRTWAKNQYLFLSARESHRRCESLKLIRRLEERGFSHVVLKGFAVGQYYAAPDCRISGDLDLLVDQKDETSLCAYLASEEGCHVTPRGLGNHSLVQHPVLGLLEIHVSLYYDYTAEQWFEGEATDAKYPPMRVESADGAYSVLHPQDAMLFLLLHAAKHFVTGGLNIRVLTDCAIFYTKNIDRLDMQPIWDMLDRLRLLTLIEAYFYTVAQAGFTLPKELDERLNAKRELLLPLVEKLKTDMEEHIFVRDDESYSRVLTMREFTRKRLGEKRFAAYIERERRKANIKRVFPSRLLLLVEYPVLRKAPLLLPAIWGVRAVKKLFKHAKYSDETKALQIERLRLFEEMGMLN